MTANYTEIGRIDNLESGFQQDPFVHIFGNFHIIIINQQRIVQITSFEKILKKKKKKISLL